MLFKLVLTVIFAAAAAVADDPGATTSAVTDPPEWAAASTMQLQLTLHSSKPSAQLPVVPSTTHIGLNQSSNALRAITVSGSMVAINTRNYNDVKGPSYIAYLSCDNNDSESFISPDKMLNTLMDANLAAIVLYSTSLNWCSFENDGPNPYSSILSMADSGDAAQVAKYLTDPDGNLPAIITGTGGSGSTKKSGSSGNSAVAMSVLYSITGLITLLFLVIIVTGTVRAHRHPERYGPRGAFGGRPRQSRAKGIARAVLDTIPIVKFGNQEPIKPDPEVELESASTVPRETKAAVRRASEASSSRDVAATGAAGDDGSVTANKRSSTVAPAAGDIGAEDNSLGCSICTEDFRVGEDVRVLPCSHQFHPGCVDPWLINVSGTCPLCRLDLQPDKKKKEDRRGSASTSEIGDSLPPPLNLDLGDSRTNRASSQRLSHFFDTSRLRTASREERLAALREMRTALDSNDARSGDNEDEGHRNASLAAKLKEKFRIRTRAQSSAALDPE